MSRLMRNSRGGELRAGPAGARVMRLGSNAIPAPLRMAATYFDAVSAGKRVARGAPMISRVPDPASGSAARPRRLLELQAAVGAGAVDQRGGGAAGRARRVLAVGVGRGRGKIDGREALAGQAVAPVVAHQRGEPGQVILLDQEVRPGASTLAGARRAADEDGDAFGEAAVAQGFHVGDRAGHGGDERQAVEELLGGGGGDARHLARLRHGRGDSKQKRSDCRILRASEQRRAPRAHRRSRRGLPRHVMMNAAAIQASNQIGLAAATLKERT
jgi:hypothetical protein